MIESAVRKGSSLTRQLLSFAARQACRQRWSTSSIASRNFARFCANRSRGISRSNSGFRSRRIPVKIDPDEFEIALLNLTLNARDAMPDGGRITISVRTTELNENSGAPTG